MKTELLKQLEDINLNPNIYFNIIKNKIKKYGLDENKLSFSKKKNKKFNYDGVDFGDGRYKDYIIWSFLEYKNKVPKNTAIKKRELYRKRAINIKGDWWKNKISPNNLAINILW